MPPRAPQRPEVKPAEEGPAALGVGCYQVTTGGTGRTTFDVTADGRVVERAAAATAATTAATTAAAPAP